MFRVWDRVQVEVRDQAWAWAEAPVWDRERAFRLRPHHVVDEHSSLRVFLVGDEHIDRSVFFQLKFESELLPFVVVDFQVLYIGIGL